MTPAEGPDATAEAPARKGLLRRLQVPVMLLTLAGLAWLLAKDFRGTDFVRLLHQADWGLLGLAVLPGLAGLLLKGVRLCWIGESFGFRFGLLAGLKYQVIAISLATLTPGRAGEFSKVFLLARRQKDQLATATLAVLLERVFDLMALGLLALSFCLISLHNTGLSLALVAMMILLLSLGFGLLWVASRDLSRLERLLPARLHFLIGEMPGVRLGGLLLPALLTLLIWCLDGLVQWLILLAAGFHVPLLPVLGINSLVAIASVLSLLPVGLGTVELSSLVLYGSSLHIPQAGVLFLVAAARVLGLTPLFGLFALIAGFDRDLLASASRKDAQAPEGQA